MGKEPSDYGDPGQYRGFHVRAAHVGRSSEYDQNPINNQTSDHNVQANVLNKNPNFFANTMGSQVIPPQTGLQQNTISSSGGEHEIWANSNTVYYGSHSDTAADMEPDYNIQRNEIGQSSGVAAFDTSDNSKEKYLEQKTLRRLAQNREAARKSRLRKKAYVQQLENSRLKLSQLEQELERARQQGINISNAGDQFQGITRNGLLPFDTEYVRWIEEHNRQINELRTALNSYVGDTELRNIVDNVTRHFNDVFGLKGNTVKVDVLHILSGMWKTPVERFFMWIGGFRPSEFLKIITSQLESITQQQVTTIHDLQQSSHQVEVSLTQGMEALQQSLAQTLANSSSVGSSENVANYMDQMAKAMGMLGTLEGFLRQAENLRQQTLQQMHRVLTTRQSACALILINDYISRLKELSSLACKTS